MSPPLTIGGGFVVGIRWLLLSLFLLAASVSQAASEGSVSGALAVNGKETKLTFAEALEVDSNTEPGYMDVVVVLADRPLSAADILRTERMERLVRDEGLAALRLVLDPDARIKSATPYHPAATSFVSSAAFVRWKPSSYDETKVAGRVYTDGEQKAFGQRWRYDLQFSAPIVLDPEAKTIPR